MAGFHEREKIIWSEAGRGHAAALSQIDWSEQIFLLLRSPH
jgi:hypothetical protein